ncbi:MAG: hypothetical protein A2W99_00515 [Bacteroidetes bacterium GWF2_33_16]|nr:MAG: hypothetical protein A2X00_03220 [Bacteroidetes bacterium GWE2_32_14]OFY08754.1 MAG: hypothetical protein A2W99_00515 [Bacteroidetes bacterium GWF2_33_16]
MAKKEVKAKAAPKKIEAKKDVVKKVASKPKAKKTQATDEEIKARAYEIYVESGYQGSELENWIKAEKELTGRK